ncbi:MAG: hypothetical protein ACJ72E_01700 [Marmoricola sp.]
MSRSARARALPGTARRRRPGIVRLVTILVGLTIAAFGVPGWTTAPTLAAGTTSDGSDWGYTGNLHTPSAVTLAWDNTGTPDVDQVPRDGTQTLPHTDGKTYDDIPGSTVSSYFQTYGAANGLGGLKVKVSQTRDLVNQSVTLDVSGVKGGAQYGQTSHVYLQVFQCWGGLNSNGTPDRSASEPDPATCQMGAGDAAARSGGFALANSRYINTDPLVSQGGDWNKYFNKGGANDVPFTSVDGKKSGSTNGNANQFFNAATTNEVSQLHVSPGGTATRAFEVQTTLESAGLGCGLRRGVVSTRSCWLVIVPRIDGVLDQNGPISPSLWGQRMQVKLGFRDIVAGCPSGQVRTLTVGSELLSTAAASWTPGLCDAKNIALGYTQLGDPVARGEFESGAADAVLTTQPTDRAGTIYTPVALSAPVFAYALSYQPFCAAKSDPYTEEEAHHCGYASVAALDADIARSGTLVRDLRLDPRLVAKLFTQSYEGAIFDKPGFRRSGWMLAASRPFSLADDPEFVRLNPSLAHISKVDSAVANLDHFVLEALRSDSASAIWTWILGDKDASAFLSGCPDANGMTINPFYSTRTYAGCGDKATALAAQADADRKATPTPASYVDEPVTYPPDGSPFPLIGWQEAPASSEVGTFGVYDFLPRVDSMPVAGRDVAIGYSPRNDTFCQTFIDDTCVPAPGVWKDSKARQPGDRLGVMSVTTAATAARFQLPTALLCNTAGTHCAGANNTSLEKAASKFVDTSTTGVQAPGAADYGSGAYPLAMPVYVGVPAKLDLTDRTAYANALQYLTTTGQKPGFSPGNLPPGYAPLTSAMRKQAAAAIADLRKATPTATSTSDGPGKTGGTTTGDSGALPGSQPPPAPSAAAGPKATVTLTSPQFENVSATGPSFPRWPLPLGLAVALIAALAGPLLRLRSTFKIG